MTDKVKILSCNDRHLVPLGPLQIRHFNLKIYQDKALRLYCGNMPDHELDYCVEEEVVPLLPWYPIFSIPGRSLGENLYKLGMGLLPFFHKII